MNKFVLYFALLALLSTTAYPKCSDRPLIVAVIDTGFGFQGHGAGTKLCKYGHKDFSSVQSFTTEFGTVDPVPTDSLGHGTNVVGVIANNAKDANYCIVVLKYHGYYGNVEATIKSIDYAISIKADYINYSSGGDSPVKAEREVVERFLNYGGTMIAAAGNNSVDLDRSSNSYYPAMYDKRIVVVGSLNREGNKLPSSNYGSVVNRWEIGLEVTGYGITMSGTSQATATATGKILSKNPRQCDIGKQ